MKNKLKIIDLVQFVLFNLLMANIIYLHLNASNIDTVLNVILLINIVVLGIALIHLSITNK